MDLNFFENDICCQMYNINLKYEENFNFFKKLFKEFSKILQEYFKNISQKAITKTNMCGSCYPLYTLIWGFVQPLCGFFGIISLPIQNS
jgi:hypothetical protein